MKIGEIKVGDKILCKKSFLPYYQLELYPNKFVNYISILFFRIFLKNFFTFKKGRTYFVHHLIDFDIAEYDGNIKRISIINKKGTLIVGLITDEKYAVRDNEFLYYDYFCDNNDIRKMKLEKLKKRSHF